MVRYNMRTDDLFRVNNKLLLKLKTKIPTNNNLKYHRQPKLTMKVTCGTILRNVKMAVNREDLYGNAGYRFKKISILRNSR